jgi:integrase
MTYKWDDAVSRWQAEGNNRALSTIRRERYLLTWAGRKLAGRQVSDIRAAHLLDLRSDALLAGWTSRTANYLVGSVCTVLRACFLWEWRSEPVPKIKPLRLPPPRRRWLHPDEARQLVLALPDPVSDMAALSLETGLRLGNIRSLRWDQVDLVGSQLHIEATATKGRQPLTVPLTRGAGQLLRGRQAANDDGGLVFHRRGRAVACPNGKAWRQAVRSVGLTDLRWHDLRHTWASWHVQSGTPIAVLKELGGWKTLAMVLRYAHLDTGQMRLAVARMEQWRGDGPRHGP